MEIEGIKPIRIFPELYNIKPFINREHPEYHPQSHKYIEYWEEQEKRCLEGFWGLDNDSRNLGGWRWMPGNLYYYINFCVIKDEDEDGNATVTINPLLRDIDWWLSYSWITARGFSGFDNDPEYTCNRIVKKWEKVKEAEDRGIKLNPKDRLTPKEEAKLHQIPHIKKEDGSFKKYIDARDYLKQTFDKPKGKALFGNEAKNLMVLGPRGWGKSYYAGNAVIGHEYTFFGKKYFDDKYLIDPSGVEIYVGSAIAAKSSDLLKKFSQSQDHIMKNIGSWGKHEDFVPGYFYVNSEGSLGPNNNRSPYRHEYEKKVAGTWVREGTGTVIYHGVFTTENPQAAVGTRPTVIVIEEVGLMPNLLTVLGANDTAQRRKNKFGSTMMIGTAGNMEKILESKIVFEDPESWHCLGFTDLWENRAKPIGFFVPAYYVDSDFKDENGNTDLDKALAQELYMRKVLSESPNSAALDEYMMSRPIIPSEMFLSPTANIFPTAKLRQWLSEVEAKQIFETLASIGDLHWTDPERKSVKWDEYLGDGRLSLPITELNLDSYKHGLNSKIVVYEHPVEFIANPTYRRSLYKVVYDPIRDEGHGTSLGAILVYKGFADGHNPGEQDSLVAEWIGRYDQPSEMHEIALKLAHYYNALILPENNIPGFINYCKMKGYVHKLMINPHEAVSKAVANPSKKYEWGVNMGSKQLSIHCEQLIREWLLEPWKTLDDGKVLYNLNKIKSPRILKELINYDREQNMDGISALKVLMLWLSQEREQVFKEEDPSKDEYEELDKFFEKEIKRSSHRRKASAWFS